MTENYDPIINLRPVEQVTTSGTVQEDVPDVDGVVIFLGDTGSYPLHATPYTLYHRLGKTPKGMICFYKDGFSDVYYSAETDEAMTFHREDDTVNMKVLVY